MPKTVKKTPLVVPKPKPLTIFIAVAIFWFIISAGYIAVDQWQDFQLRYAQNAYKQGAADAITQIIDKSATCQPIPLFRGEQQVQLIALDCLQQQPPATDEGE